MRPRRAVILATPTFISPFGDPVTEVLFTDERLADHQKRVLESLGLEVIHAQTVEAARDAVASAPGGMALLLLDRIFISRKAALRFLKAAGSGPRPAALTLRINASVRYMLPLQDILVEAEHVVHDVLLVDRTALEAELSPDPVRFTHQLRDHARRVVVPNRELVVDVPLPALGRGERNILAYPVTSTLVASIEHWVHVLWLNQIAFGVRWMELLSRRPFWAMGRVLSALSFRAERILDRLVHRGRGAEVHPTAYLSGAIIGKDVKIGAHATVRSSIVGDGAVIGDHAVLLNSVVGAGTYIAENTFMVSTACYPGASIGNYKLQVSLIGRDAYINAWAGFVDAKFVGDVMVQHEGQLRSSGRAFLGSVVGHRAKIAAKVLIQPGREIPNDTVVVMRPDEVVSVIPPGLPEGVPLVRDRGTLVRLGEESRPE